MRIKHLSVLIHIRNKDAVDIVKHVQPSSNFVTDLYTFLTVPRRCFFCEPFLLFVFNVILSFLFLAALWSPAGKGLASWFSFMLCFLAFLSLSNMMHWVRCGI